MADPEYEELEHVLESARKEILRQEPELAIAELRSVAPKVDGHEGDVVWAKFSLRLAEAYAAMNDSVAEDFFRDALSRAAKLDKPCGEFLFEAHKNFGAFLARNKHWRRALKQYQQAEEWAVRCGLKRDLDTLVLMIEEAKLQAGKNPESRNFLVLRRVAYRKRLTSKKISSAWRIHIATGQEARAGTIFRREAVTLSEAYFEDLLDQVDLSEDEN
jgi:Tfp pilus assembly protein PilF